MFKSEEIKRFKKGNNGVFKNIYLINRGKKDEKFK